MSIRDARLEGLSTWLLEFSVLWAVFPLLDMFVDHRTIDVSIVVLSGAISLTTGVAGLIIKRG